MFREIVRKKKALDRESCIRILKEEPRGVLSVLGDGGYPYGMPMDHWYNDDDGCLYFHSGDTGHKIDALKACPKASFCVMDPGVKQEGDWALTIQSVIVFGRVEFIGSLEEAIEITRRLSYKYTQDTAFIEGQIAKHTRDLLCFKLVPEHITGKRVKEE